MNTYLRIVVIAIILLVGWRMVAPWLVSMQNDVAVWVGIGVAVLTPIAALQFWRMTSGTTQKSESL